MAGSITPTNQFAAQAGPIPLSQLDTNFSQAATQLNSLGTFSNAYQDTGTTNAWVITVPSPQIVAYTFGLNLSVRVANNVTGPCTINVNGLGAKSVTNADGTAIVSGNIVAGAIVDLFYDGTQFQVNGGTQSGSASVPNSRTISTIAPLTGGGALSSNLTLGVNQFAAAQPGVVPASGGGTTTFLRADGTWAVPGGAVVTGSFTGTYTGFTTTPTPTIFYRIVGPICWLFVNTSTFGTSNATTFTITGLPALVQPTNAPYGVTTLFDNGGIVNCFWQIGGSILTFAAGTVSGTQLTYPGGAGGFTASGTKGLLGGWQISYPVA